MFFKCFWFEGRVMDSHWRVLNDKVGGVRCELIKALLMEEHISYLSKWVP